MSECKNLRKNQKITFKKREQLIRLVIEEKWSVKRAGMELGLKKSTSKMIILKYKSSGFLTKFKDEKRRQIKKLNCKEDINAEQKKEIKENSQISQEKEKQCFYYWQKSSEQMNFAQNYPLNTPILMWNGFSTYWFYPNQYYNEHPQPYSFIQNTIF